MSRGFTRRFEQFNKLLGNDLLENYFGISQNFKLLIQSSNENEIKLTIIYFSQNKFLKIKNLPFEINCVIHSYLYNKMELNILMTYPFDYPFKSPQWSLLEVNHNFTTILDIEKYYNYIILLHNLKYNIKNWSPAITISNDILDFN